MRLFRRQPPKDPWVMLPPSEFIPQVRDFLDEGSAGEREKIQPQEATEEKPATLSAKDPTYKPKVSIVPVPVPPQPQLQRSTPSPEDEGMEWEMLDSQCISNPNDNHNATSNAHQGQTYVIDDDDDMYGDVALEYSTFPAIGKSTTTDFSSGILGPDPARTNPQTVFEKRRMNEKAERRQTQSEEVARKQEEEEDALAEARLEAQKLKEKKAQEKTERLKEAIRRKKRNEEDAILILENERQIKEQEASLKQAERTKTAQVGLIPPNHVEQDPEEALPLSATQPIENESDAESIMSAASDSPSDLPSDRLDRMLLLRAQMVQMEGRLKGLTSPDSSQEIKQTKKILRKMRRQAERRYAAGTSLAQYMDDFDDDDTVSLDGFDPKFREQKIEEKFEALLSPDANSLFVKIILSKSPKEAKKQKSNVVTLLQKYNLTPYTSEMAINKKILIVDIPEEVFTDWLTEYRIKSTRREEPDEEEPENIWG